MSDELLAKQLMLYSNAIVAFIVVQSLTFCFYFGANEFFNRVIKEVSSLSVILVILFFVTFLLAELAMAVIGKNLAERAEQKNKHIIKVIFLSKGLVILIFQLLPIFLMLKYAVFIGTL